MASLILQLPAKVKMLAKARAAEAGFEDVGQFVTQLIVGEAIGAPEGLTVDSNSDLATLLASRIDGPFVEVNAEDFQQIRKKLHTRLKTRKART